MKHIDLHVVVVVLMVLLISVFTLPLKIAALVVAVLPQFIVLTRAMDRRRAGKSAVAYLIATEAVIVVPALLCLVAGASKRVV